MTSPTAATTDSEGRLSPDRFRQVAGHFATGVTVLTTGHPGELLGTTVNSFVTVSTDPLLVLVSLVTDGRARTSVGNAGNFVVNILGADQAETARRFARSDRPTGVTAFADLRWRPAPHSGAPILLDGIGYFECRVTEAAAAGDHTLYIAAVRDFDLLSDTEPLLFVRSRLTRC
ncbi:flavin reductase (DIM6/NTAB) family NADH-FMN oxidoreductase RutF [Micromonospora luteifusca]|uniref:Flavin reductase (DIM6/NTAB) family NADH-FMN oxidoreductase RutF n=1 Tax=Micromonospora luteifusca TaxID=709860 RepID=A0ABS2LN77_9ACTN|nr:flavin reductase family protein [Micromonospora luteifusca]MBM7489369.1 flavin reductase (DIM6/NTAB) family NADH-FMN oxidoreductase RutF [Micromonospora luteifusca]